ncbi:hypothetical protein Plo01_17010 [Planobispora longispora]|uniref:Uncharacterized protein n=1 Tax=Planobispora longispora TaxID=28887 RepID=A0A8J3W402_9ACTN|nr:hypothetical protein GCM10020093_076290 [Planobispora longispora]GIH75272.1 hypothetical protein Plo01_17010 [Planobispora longispora]
MFTVGRALASDACAADIPDAPVRQATRAAAVRPVAHEAGFIVSPAFGCCEWFLQRGSRFRVCSCVRKKILLSACSAGFLTGGHAVLQVVRRRTRRTGHDYTGGVLTGATVQAAFAQAATVRVAF